MKMGESISSHVDGILFLIIYFNFEQYTHWNFEHQYDGSGLSYEQSNTLYSTAKRVYVTHGLAFLGDLLSLMMSI